MPLSIGDRVRNVRRPDVIGVVTSLDAPNNQWCSRIEDHRIIVRYPRITMKSNGQWKGGELDELPFDLLRTGEQAHVAFDTFKRTSFTEGRVIGRMIISDRRRRKV
jgi:hypothetical protein